MSSPLEEAIRSIVRDELEKHTPTTSPRVTVNRHGPADVQAAAMAERQATPTRRRKPARFYDVQWAMDFVRARLEEDPHAEMAHEDIHEVYAAWAESHGSVVRSPRALAIALGRLGYELILIQRGPRRQVTGRRGLRLRGR